MGTVRLLMKLLVMAYCVCGSSVLSAVDSPVSKEYQIKAAFLYNFTKFVEWTPDRFQETNSPIVIGVLGKNPFGGELETIVKGRTVNGREISVKFLESTNRTREAHVIFVGAGQEAAFRSVFRPSGESGVLTVGESPQSASLGAMITFMMEGDKVRFEINTESSDRAGVKISAQLQKLAKTVRRKP